MKLMKMLTATLLLTATVLTAFASCAPKNKGDEGKSMDISGYTLIRPTKTSNELVKAVATFKNVVENTVGIDIPVKEDWVKPGETLDEGAKEILIGETNRKASADAKAKLDADENENAFIIEVTDTKIVILAKNYDALLRALKYFIVNAVRTSKKEGCVACAIGDSEIKIADVSTVMLDNFTELCYSEEKAVFDKGAGYGSVIQYPTAVYLRFQADSKNNGTMIATANSSESIYHIVRSTDDGETWKEITAVSDTLNSKGAKPLQAGRMPFLYELPVDMGDFKKGTVFLAGTSSPKGGSKATYEGTAITLYYSTDLGKSWKQTGNIDLGMGQIDGNGVWEPFLIYEEETKRLYCFYSDATGDTVPGDHDQKLVYKYTTDLKKWTGMGGTDTDAEPFEALASENCTDRPGMVSISKMSNGEYILTYEYVGVKGYGHGATTFYKTAKRLDDWGDVSDMGKPVVTADKKSSGSGPWNVYTPVGSENGILFSFARFAQDYPSSLEKPYLYISLDCAKTFICIENPFDYKHLSGTSKTDRAGYSPCMISSPDGKTVYFFNNPTYGKANQTYRITMVRIDIIE